jgi:DNA-directed RNA polymerase specialized sigma24 family protein
MPPPEPSDANPRFQPTRWGVVLRARGSGPETRRAFEGLYAIYWFPLVAWCRARGHPPAHAEDLIQRFFLKALGSYESATRSSAIEWRSTP